MSDSSQISKYLKFKQGTAKGLPKAPHKPILILSVIKGIETGLISDNKIFITPELVSFFRSFWDKLVVTGHTPNFSLPFFHLKNEKSGIWKLKCKPGFDSAITSSNSIKSFKALNETTEYAFLDKAFYDLLKIKEIRDQIKGEIIERYFPEANISLLRKDYSYLDILEEQILNDSAITYSNRVKQILETKEAEEDVFMRGGAFKRQIPKLYNYSCAITGMKVESVGNISLIDACHIVPFAESHNDTVSNGIALCPNMHRAFDRGLISIDENYRVLVSDIFIENYTSYSIHQFEGKEIHLPEISRYYPAQENLEKHRQRFNFG